MYIAPYFLTLTHTTYLQQPNLLSAAAYAFAAASVDGIPHRGVRSFG